MRKIIAGALLALATGCAARNRVRLVPHCAVEADVYVPPNCYSVVVGNTLEVRCARQVTVDGKPRTEVWTVRYKCDHGEGK